MAGFMDMLNQGLTNVTSSPVGQLSLQMLMNSGYMPNNPSGGARLGASLAGMSEMQQQQQEMQYRAQLRKQQEQELALRAAALQRQQDQQTALQRLAQDPEFLSQNPQARSVLSATGDMGLAASMAKLVPTPKAPTMPGVFEKYNPDNTVTQQIWNPQTQSYDSGPAYTKPDQMRAGAYVAKTEQDMQMAPQELGIKATNAMTQQQRVDVMKTETARKQAASALKNRINIAGLEQGYRGATTQIDDTIKLVDELLAPDSGLDSNYGVRGWIPNAPGIDAANARARLERLKATSGLTELNRLKQLGVVLTPVSNTDLSTVSTAATALDAKQDAASARKELARYRDVLMRSKGEAEQNFNAMVGAYNPQGQAPAQQQPVQIQDDAGYNALPSGTIFIAPDGSERRKP